MKIDAKIYETFQTHVNIEKMRKHRGHAKTSSNHPPKCDEDFVQFGAVQRRVNLLDLDKMLNIVN